MAVPKALVAIDFSASEAKIISYLIDHQKSTIGEMMLETSLSRATVYKCLNNLVSKGYIDKSEKWIPYSTLNTDCDFDSCLNIKQLPIS